MSPRLAAWAALPCLMWGCAGSAQSGPGAARLGAPRPAFDPSIVAAGPRAAVEPIGLPDRITLPASYRLVMLDGHMALVRETDAQATDPAPTSMRVISGEIARGELAYQPALLPQELAAEVAANRESAARMDNALESVMRRSRELSEQALQAQAQARRMAELLSAAEARIRELSAAAPKPPGPSARAPDAPDPRD